MYDVFSKIDDIENTGTSSGSGAIPKLSTPEENIIENSVKVIQKVTKDYKGWSFATITYSVVLKFI